MSKIDWQSHRDQLENLVNQGLTDKQMADHFGCKSGALQTARIRLFGPRYKMRCSKYDRGYIKEVARHYYRASCREETIKYFGLSAGQFHAIMTVAYREGLAKVKDKRRKDPWSVEETLFLLQHAGIKPRSWIARRLKRGGIHAVKEAHTRLGLPTRHVNGPPQAWLRVFFPTEVQTYRTNAGPGKQKFLFAPWVTLTRYRAVDPQIVRCIRIMAKFQRWIFEAKTNKETIEKIHTILRKKNQ